jgi:hypothetical protein
MTDIDAALSALSLDVEKPQRMPLLHYQTRQPLRGPNGEEAYVDLYSSDSDIARRHNRETQRRRLNMRGRGKLTPEELEAEATDLLVALTAGWSLVALDGSMLGLPFSAQNARVVYDKVTWIREQVDEFAADRGNFTRASSSTSSNGPSPSSGRAAKP